MFAEKAEIMNDTKEQITDSRTSIPESGLVAEIVLPVEDVYVVDSLGKVRLSNGLQPGLKNRMINLMAICGILGPGTFVGMGSMLATGGGAGMLAGFAIVGLLVISMMFSESSMLP